MPLGAQTPSVLANISTRLRVETGDNVLIGGFIITGTQPKKVIVRAIGPSLPVAGALADPILELNSGGTVVATNDNWMDAPNRQEIIDSTVPPTNNAESAILMTLNPGTYTAIVRGVNNTTGVALVEAYDLNRMVDSKLANISTRGLVQTGDNVLIGGFIIVGTDMQRVLMRAIGPSLPVAGNLADPILELHDGNGATLATNDNWMDAPNRQEIIDTTIPPTNNAESAILQTLAPATYTAIVRGANATTGVALVEVYGLGAPPAGTPAMFIVNGGDATPATASVTKANLDGTGGASLGNIGGFLNSPQGIAINKAAGKMYVTNEGGDTVTMSDLNGAGAVNLTVGGLLAGPYGIALDVAAGKMYVSNGGGAGNTPRIVVANLDGSTAVDLGNLNNLLNTPQGMAIDVAGGKMYVANQNGTIVQANLNGTGATALTLGGLLTGTIPLDVTLDVAGNRMYVVDFNGKLFRADLSGGNAADLGNLGGTLNGPRGIGLDITGGKLYIGNAGNNTVTRADLPDATNPVALSVATLNSPAVVAVYRP